MSEGSPWLRGALAPVYEEITETDLEVHGELPAEFNGRFVKIGPNPVRPPSRGQRYRAFLAPGMVHGVRLRGGRAEWYRNRWVRSAGVSRALGEPRVPGPRHALLDQVNTHVIGHSGRTLALVEAGCTPAELGYDLDTLRYTDFEGTLSGGFSAHPKKDPVTGELHAITYRFGRRDVRYVVLGADARIRRAERVPVPTVPVMHDMALTERHVVLFDSPARVATLREFLVRRRVYRWNPAHPTRFGLLRRDAPGSSVRWFDTAPGFILHTVNAFEDNGKVILRGIRYDRLFDETLLDPDRPKPHLWEWVIDPVTGRVTDRQLDDLVEEMPRIDDRRSTLPHRYAYSVTVADPPESVPSCLVKRDLLTGRRELGKYPEGIGPSEPVFVPRAGGTAEDDGWVLSYVTDLGTDRSTLCVHHAQDLLADPVATVPLPVRVPTGFHGSWIPD